MNELISNYFQKNFIDFDKIKFNKIKNPKKIKISIISDFNTSYLEEGIKKILSYDNIDCDFLTTDYGTLSLKLENLQHPFWKNKSDIYILLPALNFFNKIEINNIVRKYKNLWNAIDRPIIQTLFPLSTNKVLSYQDNVTKDGKDFQINLLNHKLIKQKRNNVDLIDLNYAYINFQKIKSETILDYIADQPFNMDGLPGIVHILTNNIKGILGFSKKVIILDLDNTLWGGVIGEIGFDKINLNPEDNVGKGYLNFQRYLLELKKRGILLAVCSKNNENIAKDGFKKNTNSILKLTDFTKFIANFKSKTENIKVISKKINMPLSNMIFMDDSKFECESVKANLPDVTVIELDCDPNLFSKKLEEKLLFYFKKQTNEDKKRTESYKKIEKLEKDLKKEKNLRSFLKKIKTKLKFSFVDNSSSERTVQLFSKTNQFNFNKKTFTSKEVLKKKRNFITIEAEDKYQNYGIISVINFAINKKNLEIINWVLSCRVFSRYIEYEILKFLTEKFKLNKNSIKINFKKSEKNKYLYDFLNSIDKKNYKDNCVLNFEKYKDDNSSIFKIINKL